MKKLIPRLVVKDVGAIQPFYETVLGVRVDPAYVQNGRVVHADVFHGDDAVFSLSEAMGEDAPKGPTPLVMELETDDPDAVWALAMAHGATELHPLADQPYGHRAGRFRDPAGHQWMPYKVIRTMSRDEIQASLD